MIVKVRFIFTIVVLVTAVGCATIAGDKTQLVGFNSNPTGAEITVVDEKGSEIFKGITPTQITLEKSDGSYWGGKNYTVAVSKAGYDTQVIPIQSHPNGWYIAGNFVFGGLIGWFIVDPFSGSMYTLAPEKVSATLHEMQTSSSGNATNSLKIVQIEDVPETLKDEMIKIR